MSCKISLYSLLPSTDASLTIGFGFASIFSGFLGFDYRGSSGSKNCSGSNEVLNPISGK
jgi:hypothetical protein